MIAQLCLLRQWHTSAISVSKKLGILVELVTLIMILVREVITATSPLLTFGPFPFDMASREMSDLKSSMDAIVAFRASSRPYLSVIL